MAHPFYPSGTPRMNHVALQVPRPVLDPEGRADLCRFFEEVFGFTELPTLTADGKRLVFSCVHWDQFLFLTGHDDVADRPSDHVGFAVGSLDELQALRDRAAAFAEGDPRMVLDDLQADDQGPVVIHSVYVEFLLPVRIEVQWWEFAA